MKSIIVAMLILPTMASAADTKLRCDFNWNAYDVSKAETVDVKGETHTVNFSKHTKATVQRTGSGYRVIISQDLPPVEKASVVYDVSCDTKLNCTGKRDTKEAGEIKYTDAITWLKKGDSAVALIGEREFAEFVPQGKGFVHNHVEYFDETGKAYGLSINCRDAALKRDVAQEARSVNISAAARQTQAQVTSSLTSADGRASVARGQQLVQAGAPGKCVMCHTAGPNGFVPRDRNATAQINLLRQKLREPNFLSRVHTRLLVTKQMPMGGSPQLTDQGRIDIRNYLASFAQ